MQNLKDIGKRKEANTILILSIIFTLLSIGIINIPERPETYLTFACNIIGGFILAEYYYKKYFPKPDDYGKKKIWKPLIISIIISIPFLILAFM